jgi:geranylgeranyl transferase type-2 subunit beta
MEPGHYLLSLTARLAEGLARLPAELRDRHARYLRGAQNPDGGFSGREGGSDLYYSGFALRGLLVLGELAPETCARAADYLRPCLTQPASVVDFFSLLYSCLLVRLGGGPDILADSPTDWPNRVAAMLETFRTPEGGYGKVAGAVAGSTYHTFLVGLCYELLGRTLPRPEEVLTFIQSRQREDGGYVEIGPMRRSGTNPTAAAVGVLELIGSGLTPEVRAGVVDLLADLPTFEGGLRANTRAPLADLLSTFTGLWTLARLEALNRIDMEPVRNYVEGLDMGAGFRGGLWDDRVDVEYTFYGLGVLALTR